MQNKKLFKILAFVAGFILIIFSWIVIKDARDKRIENTPASTGLENPFGTSSGQNDLNGSEEDDNNGSSSSTDNQNPPANPVSTTTIIVEDNPVLKALSSAAVAGFTFTSEEREIPEPDSTTPEANIVEVFDFSGYKTIKFGDVAEEIVAIKTVLNRTTPSPGLVIDNTYDTDMKNAVVDFQNKNSLTGDGVIGAKTYAKLNSFQGIATFTGGKKAPKIEIVPLVRYVDASSGLVEDQALHKQEAAIKRTTTAIPRVVEAFFDDTATRVVMRYLKDDVIQTYIAKLTFAKADSSMTKEERDALPKTATVTGDFLPENIKTIAVSTDRKNIFFMNSIAGGVAGNTYVFGTKVKKQIWSTPLSEWIANWAGTKINLTTKASGLVSGYSYSLTSTTGAMSKNIGDVKGLTTLLSPDGKKLLYSSYSNNMISTFILDIPSGKATSISPSAMPEKCLWTKDSKFIYCAAPVKAVTAVYPDDWYKGKITFDDALWKIDMRDMSGNILYDFVSKNKVKIDATNLQLNASENYLGFINKKDGILWGFDLSR